MTGTVTMNDNELDTLTRHSVAARRAEVSMSLPTVAAVLSVRLGRRITMATVAGWEAGYIAIPKDLTLDMIQPGTTVKEQFPSSEIAMWARVENRLKPNVLAAAVALCRMRDAEEEDQPCPCQGGGECHAFRLFGREAITVTDAIDNMQAGKLHGGIFDMGDPEPTKR